MVRGRRYGLVKEVVSQFHCWSAPSGQEQHHTSEAGGTRAKPDGEPYGQLGNKAKHKSKVKTAATNQNQCVTCTEAVLNAEKEALAAYEAEVMKIAAEKKEIAAEKKDLSRQKQALTREGKQFARVKKAFETKVARREQSSSAETVIPMNEASVTELANMKAEHREQLERDMGPRAKLFDDDEKILEDSLEELMFKQSNE